MTPNTVMITGASAGVGRATAHRFAKEGWNVGVLARQNKSLDEAVDEVENMGGTPLKLPGDVSESSDVENAAQQLEEQFGQINVWVNNAMVTVLAPFHNLEPEEFRRVTEVTYLGAVYGTMSALKRMRKVNAGTIVQVGSALAYRSIPLQAAYCGSKHAIRGFTDSIRTELLHENSNIHITMVQLPAVNTPQFTWGRTKLPNKAQPVPPIYQPEVPADAIYWAATHKRRELLVGFNTAYIVQGNK